MKTICTKCKGDNIFIVPREEEKRPDTQTMDEMVDNMFVGIENAIYKITTWRCKDCRYEVSR